MRLLVLEGLVRGLRGCGMVAQVRRESLRGWWQRALRSHANGVVWWGRLHGLALENIAHGLRRRWRGGSCYWRHTGTGAGEREATEAAVPGLAWCRPIERRRALRGA